MDKLSSKLRINDLTHASPGERSPTVKGPATKSTPWTSP